MTDCLGPSPVKIVEKKYLLGEDQVAVTFLLIRFNASFMLWIGESAATAQLADLSLAIGTNSTPIMSNAHQLSPGLASKLSIKYNKNRPVYVALNHPMADKNDNQFSVNLNKKIIEFLNEISTNVEL